MPRPSLDFLAFSGTRSRLALLLLLVLTLLVSAAGSGARRPLDAHETFVARTATEMLRRDDWLLPTFNGEPRTQKPPLSYWLAMAAHRALGHRPAEPVGELAARAPSILGALLLVGATVLLGRSSFGDRRSAWLAGALVATSSGLLRWSHSAQPEMLYAGWCTLGLSGLAVSRAHDGRGRTALLGAVGGWLALGAAVMTKGPLLPAFLVLGWTLALALERPRPPLARVLRPWLGLLLVLACALPWPLWVWLREPWVLEYWRAQMFDRTGGLGSAWWRPIQMYNLGSVVKLGAPWSLLMLWAVVWPWSRRGREDAGARRLWWVLAVPFLALQFSANQKYYYALPILGPLGLLSARALLDAWALGRRRGLLVGLRAHALATAAGAVVLGVLTLGGGGPPPLAVWVRVLACALFALGGLAALTAWHGAAGRLLAGVALIFVGLALAGADFSERRRADASFARAVRGLDDPQRPLVCAGANREVLLQYVDRPLESISRDELAARLVAQPPARFAVDNEWLAGQDVALRELLRMRSDDEEIVLVEPLAGGGAAEQASRLP